MTKNKLKNMRIVPTLNGVTKDNTYANALIGDVPILQRMERAIATAIRSSPILRKSIFLIFTFKFKSSLVCFMNSLLRNSSTILKYLDLFSINNHKKL